MESIHRHSSEYAHIRLMLLSDEIVLGIFHKRTQVKESIQEQFRSGCIVDLLETSIDQSISQVATERIAILLASDGNYVYIVSAMEEPKTHITAFVPVKYEDAVRRVLRFRNTYAKSKYCTSRFSGSSKRCSGNGAVYWTLPAATEVVQEHQRSSQMRYLSNNKSNSMNMCPFAKRICINEKVIYASQHMNECRFNEQNTTCEAEIQSIYTHFTCPEHQHQFLYMLQRACAASATMEKHIISVPATRSAQHVVQPNAHIFQQVIDELHADLLVLLADNSRSMDNSQLASTAFAVLVESIDGDVLAANLNLREVLSASNSNSNSNSATTAIDVHNAMRDLLVAARSNGKVDYSYECHDHESSLIARLFEFNAWKDESSSSSEDEQSTREVGKMTELLCLQGEVFTFEHLADAHLNSNGTGDNGAVSSRAQPQNESTSIQFHVRMLLAYCNSLTTSEDTNAVVATGSSRIDSPLSVLQNHNKSAIRLLRFQEHLLQRVHVLRAYMTASLADRFCSTNDDPPQQQQYIFSRLISAAQQRQSSINSRIQSSQHTIDERIGRTITAFSGINVMYAPIVDDRFRAAVRSPIGQKHSVSAQLPSTTEILNKCLHSNEERQEEDNGLVRRASHRMETLQLENGTRLSAFFDVSPSRHIGEGSEESNSVVVRLRGAFPNRNIIDIDCVYNVVRLLQPDGTQRTLPLQECVQASRMMTYQQLDPANRIYLQSRSISDWSSGTISPAARSISNEIGLLMCFLRDVRIPPSQRAAAVQQRRQASIETASHLLQIERLKLIDELRCGHISVQEAARITSQLSESLLVKRLNPSGTHYSKSVLNGAWD